MKTLQLFLSVGALIALLGLNVVLADVQSNSAKGPEFPLEAGDGSSMSSINFDTTSNNTAQTTCATTPGGPSLNPLMEMPIVPVQDTEQLTQYDDLSPLGSKDSKRDGLPGRNTPIGRQPGWRIPTGSSGDDPPPPSTPEPATMLLIGLGIGGAAVVARRRLNNKNGR